MIIFKVYGLDQFVVGNYSKEHTKKLANLLECKEEDIIFYAPNSYIFHKGVEQTSWNVVVEIMAPHKYHDLQKNVSKYLLETFALFSINVHLIFNYYDEHHLVEFINKDYPRFIEDKNLVHIEEEEINDEDITDEEKVYTGNVFKDFNKNK